MTAGSRDSSAATGAADVGSEPGRLEMKRIELRDAREGLVVIGGDLARLDAGPDFRADLGLRLFVVGGEPVRSGLDARLVFRAAPGTVSNSSIVLGTLPPNSARIFLAAPTTDFALLLRIKAMVSNQPCKKAFSASGFCAIDLSVAKMTCMMKSFATSPKRIRMRPSPCSAKLSAVPISTTQASTAPDFSAAIRAPFSPIAT